MLVPVVWLNLNPDAPNRGYWDQGMLEAIFAKTLWDTSCDFEHYDAVPEGIDGAVVIVPGRQQEDISGISDRIAPLRWVVLIITGDEENTFPLRRIKHPNMKTWLMTPKPDGAADRYLGSGYPPGAPAALVESSFEKNEDWFFSGQITHDRRRACVRVLKEMDIGAVGTCLETEGFTQGLPQAEYWERLGHAKIAPCPGGPVTPDSFRLYEALEAGCVPIADGCSNAGPDHGYWRRIFGEEPAFPVVAEMRSMPQQIRDRLHEWPHSANVAGAFWEQYKRRLAYALRDDVTAVSGMSAPDDNKITVLMPTSPIPSHPSTAILEETVESVRSRLPNAEIFIMIDGIRSQQGARTADYREYTRRVLHLCRSKWQNVVPFVHEAHFHQGVMTRMALEHVRTPLVLFVEHDTPLVGDIDWDGCSGAVLGEDVNVLRFHHEASVLEPHRHLMIDTRPQDRCGAPMMRTIQWSQRPHLAKTEFYRWMMANWFGMSSRTMIEDVMHSVLETHFREEGYTGWDRFRLWLYTPRGDMKRSTHTDGRDGDPKFSMLFAYDEGTPSWSPDPGVRQ